MTFSHLEEAGRIVRLGTIPTILLKEHADHFVTLAKQDGFGLLHLTIPGGNEVFFAIKLSDGDDIAHETAEVVIDSYRKTFIQLQKELKLDGVFHFTSGSFDDVAGPYRHTTIVLVQNGAKL